MSASSTRSQEASSRSHSSRPPSPSQETRFGLARRALPGPAKSFFDPDEEGDEDEEMESPEPRDAPSMEAPFTQFSDPQKAKEPSSSKSDPASQFKANVSASLMERRLLSAKKYHPQHPVGGGVERPSTSSSSAPGKSGSRFRRDESAFAPATTSQGASGSKVPRKANPYGAQLKNWNKS
ncbi:hypothetical protein NMY22_g17054 [Coprinellus aureogranulatus]|nr:hypothetical protein NMY22_g17054 [Coprinellus aureogranulatus]